MIVRPVVAVRPVRRGFTLLEVLAVVSILVILASLATFAVARTLRNAKVNEATLKAQKIEQAIRVYYTESGGTSYPQSLQELVQGGANSGGGQLEGGPNAILDPWGQQYQFNVITDESGQERVVVSTTSPDGQQISWPRR